MTVLSKHRSILLGCADCGRNCKRRVVVSGDASEAELEQALREKLLALRTRGIRCQHCAQQKKQLAAKWRRLLTKNYGTVPERKASV